MSKASAFVSILFWTQYGVKVRWLMGGMMGLMSAIFYLYARQPVGDIYKAFYAHDTVRDYFFESFFILQIGVLMMILAQSMRMRHHPFAWSFLTVLYGRKRVWWLRFSVMQGVSVCIVLGGLLVMQVMMRLMPYDTGFTFTWEHYGVWVFWTVFYQSVFLFFEERSYSALGLGLTLTGALVSLTMMPLNPAVLSDAWQGFYSVFPALGFFSLKHLWLGRWGVSFVILGWVVFGTYAYASRKDFSASVET